MSESLLVKLTWGGVIALLLNTSLYASTPVWTYSAPNPARVTVSDGGTATVQYTVTNQSRKPKNLILKATPGLTASACHLAGKGSACALTVTVNGSLIPPQGIHAGPILCEQGNPNQCYQPSAVHVLNVSKNTVNTTSLTVTPSELALSVTGLTEYGIPSGSSTASGRERQITITNTGASAATNVGYTSSRALPTGTTITPSSCGTIASSGTCVLTITPGSTPSAAAGDTNPVPVALSISGNNTNTASTAIHVLTYGSVYQGGYVFAFDDTKGCASPTECDGSVGGKVVTASDQADPFPDGIIWSSDSSGSVEFDSIPGIDEVSTSSNASPALPSPNPLNFVACDGATNGLCNVGNIFRQYPSINSDLYAAGLCRQTIDGYSGWYLPAICEMGFDSSNFDSGCGAESTPLLQNIQSCLVGVLGAAAPAGDYWSSTEGAGNPQNFAWIQSFGSGVGYQLFNNKVAPYGVRCVRGF